MLLQIDYLHLFCAFLVHGGWSHWSEWTQCTVTCGNGTKNRHRTCNNPIPQFGGDNCTGAAREQRVCQLPPCPGKANRTLSVSMHKYWQFLLFIAPFLACLPYTVHCEWDEWSEWTECSATCEGGTKSRSRKTKVDALHGGDECQGDNLESMVCNEQDCPSEPLHFSCCGICVNLLSSANIVCLQLDPCIPVNPCFEDVECTRLSDTEFECGSCPKWAQGNGIQCEPVNEVRKALLEFCSV